MTESLRVIAFPGAPNLPVFAARELGFFAANGLELEFETTPNSVYQFEQLSAGNFDIGMTAFDNIVAYREGQGAVELSGINDFCAVMGATQISLSFVVSPDVKKYADLKGKTLALDALATGFAFVLYEMLEKNGLSLDDIEMIAVGNTPDRWMSVKDGTHAGTLTIEPFTSLAKAAGFTELDVSANVVDSYQGGIVAASREFVAKESDRVEAYIAGYLAGLDWTLDPVNYDEAKRILLENMPAIKPPVADSVMASVLSESSGLTPGGNILRDGIATVLRLRSKYGSGGELSEIDRYLDLSAWERVVNPAD